MQALHPADSSSQPRGASHTGIRGAPDAWSEHLASSRGEQECSETSETSNRDCLLVRANTTQTQDTVLSQDPNSVHSARS